MCEPVSLTAIGTAIAGAASSALGAAGTVATAAGSVLGIGGGASAAGTAGATAAGAATAAAAPGAATGSFLTALGGELATAGITTGAASTNPALAAAALGVQGVGSAAPAATSLGSQLLAYATSAEGLFTIGSTIASVASEEVQRSEQKKQVAATDKNNKLAAAAENEARGIEAEADRQATGEELLDIQTEGSRAISAGRAAAASSGVGGSTVTRILSEFEAASKRAENQTRTALGFRQASRQVAGKATGLRQRAASLSQPRVGGAGTRAASAAGNLLQIGGKFIRAA